MNFSDAFNACDQLPAIGHMYNMGAIFAASLYFAFKEVNKDPISEVAFIRWIFDSSSQIQNEDDFISFYKKLEAREPGNMNGAFSKALKNQLINRGLQIP